MKEPHGDVKRMTPSCPICGHASTYWVTVAQSADASLRHTESDYNRSRFHMFRCQRCGHGHHYPGVEDEQMLLTLYGEDYANDYVPDASNNQFLRRKEQYGLDVSYLMPFLPQGHITVLDVGCSVGEYLSVMPSSWEKHGFEVNAHEIEYLGRHHSQIRVYDDLDQIPDREFNVITLRGVIEHLFEFDTVLLLIKRAIKSGGHVFISATPDFGSPCAVVYREHWNQVCVPYHYHHFSVSSLSILFAKYGFGLKGVTHPYLATPYAEFPSDARKFIDNTRSVLAGRSIVADNLHAFPGTMMSLVFQSVE